MRFDVAVEGGRVVLPKGTVEPINIGISAGKIALLSTSSIEADRRIDAAGKTVIPGLVDQHFHCWWGYGVETHEIASRAAARGGVTTLVEMPLDKPATTTRALLRRKIDAVRSEYHVDFAMIGGVEPHQLDNIKSLVDEGVVAIKIFTGDVAPPGMYPGVDDGDLLHLMRIVKSKGIPLMAHCENAAIVRAETNRVKAEGKSGPSAWDEARPWFAEVEAVQRIALLAKVTGARVIVVHISTPEAIDIVSEARQSGVDIWTETLPHQLCIDLNSAGDDTRFKWNPPPRSREAVDELWKRLSSGSIHSIASDHAPLAKKAGADIWSQGPGAGNVLEVMLPIVATEAARRGVGLPALVEAMCANPARILGLYPRKGAIQIGADADLVVLETCGDRKIEARKLEFYKSEGKWSPYDGQTVTVYPEQTLVRGTLVYDRGEVVGPLGHGALIKK